MINNKHGAPLVLVAVKRKLGVSPLFSPRCELRGNSGNCHARKGRITETWTPAVIVAGGRHKPAPRVIDHRTPGEVTMTDQSVEARLVRAEDTINVLMTVLCQQRVLTLAQAHDIRKSVDDLNRDRVRATAPGAGNVSAEVADIIRRAKRDLPSH